MTKLGFIDDNLNFTVTDEQAQAGADLVGTIVTASKKSDAKTQAEAVCGKQPHGFLGIKSAKKKQKIADWNKCVQNVKSQEQEIAKIEAVAKIQSSTDAVKMKKIMVYGAIITTVIVGGIIVLAIYLRKKNS